MSEDYFDVAWICGERKAILHGQRADGSYVERRLNKAERDRVEALSSKHYAEMSRLLRELAA